MFSSILIFLCYRLAYFQIRSSQTRLWLRSMTVILKLFHDETEGKLGGRTRQGGREAELGLGRCLELTIGEHYRAEPWGLVTCAHQSTVSPVKVLVFHCTIEIQTSRYHIQKHHKFILNGQTQNKTHQNSFSTALTITSYGLVKITHRGR